MRACADFEVDIDGRRAAFKTGQPVPADIVKTCNLVEKGLVENAGRTAKG